MGTEELVRSDYGSLRWLKNMRDPTDQVARWIERLAPFQWKMEHRTVVLHFNADALSRKRCPGDCVQCLKMDPDYHMVMDQHKRLLDKLEETFVMINGAVKLPRVKAIRRCGRKGTREARDEEAL